MAASLIVFAASAALLQPSVATTMMACQALADSQMKPVYLVQSSDNYCQWNGYAVAYSWSSEGAQHAIYPKP